MQIELNASSSLRNRRGAISLWREVAEKLGQAIRSGTYGPGERLPTEPELCETFSVHRNTVRRALASLRERGVIRVEHGRGSFVNERLFHYVLGQQSRFSAAMLDTGRLSFRQLVGASTQRAGKSLADELQIRPTDYVRRLDTLGLLDGMPVSLAANYYPLPRFRGIDERFRESGSFAQAWRTFGVVQFNRVETRISATLFSKKESHLMETAPRGPALSLVNINRDQDGIRIVTSHMKVSPKHIEYVIRFADDDR